VDYQLLQQHPHAIIVCDEDATDELKHGTYKYFKDIEKDNDIGFVSRKWYEAVGWTSVAEQLLWVKMSVFTWLSESRWPLVFEKSDVLPLYIKYKVDVQTSKLVKNDTEYSVYGT